MLNADCKQIMASNRVPWAVMAIMAQDDEIQLQDLANRWVKPEDCRDKCADDLKLRTTLQYNDQQADRAARRMSSAVECAQIEFTKKRKAHITGEPDRLTATDRVTMLQIYTSKTQLRIPLEEQGSDTLLAKQRAKNQQGEVGHFSNRQLVSALPEINETSNSRKRRVDLDGVVREQEDEYLRYEPSNVEQWKKQMTIFRNTLLMCIMAAFD